MKKRTIIIILLVALVISIAAGVVAMTLSLESPDSKQVCFAAMTCFGALLMSFVALEALIDKENKEKLG